MGYQHDMFRGLGWLVGCFPIFFKIFMFGKIISHRLFQFGCLKQKYLRSVSVEEASVVTTLIITAPRLDALLPNEVRADHVFT